MKVRYTIHEKSKMIGKVEDVDERLGNRLIATHCAVLVTDEELEAEAKAAADTKAAAEAAAAPAPVLPADEIGAEPGSKPAQKPAPKSSK